MKGKDVILFIPDYEDYIKNCRDLVFPYNEFTKGIVANSYYELISLFKQDIKDYIMPDVEKIKNLFWCSENKDMQQLVTELDKKLF